MFRSWFGAVENINQSSKKLFYTLRTLYQIGVLLMLIYIPLHQWLGATEIVLLNLFSVVILIWCIRLTQQGKYNFSVFVGVVLVNLHCAVTSHHYGWDAGFYLYLFLVGATIFLLAKSSLYFRIGGLLLTSISMLIIHRTSLPVGSSLDNNPELLALILELNLVSVLMSLGVISYFYAASSAATESSLIEQSNTHKLSAETDQLSQLANRRGMKNVLDSLDRQLQRQNISIAILDIDHFKSTNDKYGHPAGDIVIRKIADTIINNIRIGDYASRWGGEEYLICLANSDIVGAQKVMDNIRKEIGSIEFRIEDAVIKTTVTIGVSHLDESMSMENCIEQADRALYWGKQNGRNQVVNFEVLES